MLSLHFSIGLSTRSVIIWIYWTLSHFRLWNSLALCCHKRQLEGPQSLDFEPKYLNWEEEVKLCYTTLPPSGTNFMEDNNRLIGILIVSSAHQIFSHPLSFLAKKPYLPTHGHDFLLPKPTSDDLQIPLPLPLKTIISEFLYGSQLEFGQKSELTNFGSIWSPSWNCGDIYTWGKENWWLLHLKEDGGDKLNQSFSAHRFPHFAQLIPHNPSKIINLFHNSKDAKSHDRSKIGWYDVL